jgi:hypothetical protein
MEYTQPPGVLPTVSISRIHTSLVVIILFLYVDSITPLTAAPLPSVPEYILYLSAFSPLSLRAVEGIGEGACKVIAKWAEASIARRVAEAVTCRGRLILL